MANVCFLHDHIASLGANACLGIHLLKVLGDLEGCSCLSLNFLKCNAWCEFSEGQSTLFSVDIEDALYSKREH